MIYQYKLEPKDEIPYLESFSAIRKVCAPVNRNLIKRGLGKYDLSDPAHYQTVAENHAFAALYNLPLHWQNLIQVTHDEVMK
jgi:hypothetical protein